MKISQGPACLKNIPICGFKQLEKTVMDVTNLKSDLVAIIGAQMFERCARGFVVDQGAIHLDRPEHVHRLHIKQLLSECAVRNKDTL
jgi:hypothetical protein